MTTDQMHDVGTRLGRSARVTLLLAGALVLGAMFAATYAVTVRTLAGQQLDNGAFVSWQQLNPFLGAFAQVLRPALPVALGVVCTVLGVVALRARRRRAVVPAVAVVVVTVPLARWLRDGLLDRPNLADLAYTHNTLPSGHVAVTAALCVAVLFLWPRRSGALVAWAVVVSLVACVASLLEHTHRPSDVVASLLLVGAVTCLVLAVPRRHSAVPAK
ncbi:phosphatase PAP2 family protein [Oerskovia turbata]|uniref:Phosphatase PAP2 family protein n=1 Tax=Oerskovia turbata TaxID=1713 RepID=A0A4Q1KWG3_9CELL|nr:phosphatase PAP2 family protein [Oerskovia turbata]RXR26829.1 phosphatase PAP2 family protein [Oerskovia turbata]RXR34562.1 phosphatase PAP2 family protein [Oerskovia turbata]TGJ94509.1 phosphatase PAP2 family protein [Actinotalea fermentans ATCC 43279 = JCM 9966 = DSM 3133]